LSAVRVIDLEPKALVIDASLGIKLFVIEAGSEQVDRLFSLLAIEPAFNFFVPDLFYVECANVLWKYVKHHAYPAASAHQDIVDLRALRLHSIPTAELVAEALELALEFDLTAYDACYFALARRLELPLITADTALAKKMAETSVKIVALENI
jgi:predicted nucleic acid-binding protein